MSPGGSTTRPAGSAPRCRARTEGSASTWRPWAVSDDASKWLDGFETVDEAMAAADRYVADRIEAIPLDRKVSGSIDDDRES
jgi:hypothetical protein